MKILIAEDHRQIREVTPMILSQYLTDAEFVETKDGLEAVQAALNDKFDVILMDIRMPKLDGVKAIQQIRSFDKSAWVFVISAYDDATTRQAAVDAGADAFFQKPISYHNLAVALRTVQRRAIKGKTINNQVGFKRERLEKLREKEAIQGLNTPAEILVEIEKLESEIENLQAGYDDI